MYSEFVLTSHHLVGLRNGNGHAGRKGDTLMLSPRFPRGRALMAAAATSLAAAGMIAVSATALADAGGNAPTCANPNADGTCPPPGTATPRSSDMGVAQAGPSTVTGAPRGTASGNGPGASKGAPILIHDGNQARMCYANRDFVMDKCGLPPAADGFP